MRFLNQPFVALYLLKDSDKGRAVDLWFKSRHFLGHFTANFKTTNLARI